MYSVGEIISSNRKKMGYSQPVLASELEKEGISISYKTISSWEKNCSEPSVTTFLHLCKILNISDVFTGYFGFNPGNPLSTLNEEGTNKVLEYINLLLLSPDYRKHIVNESYDTTRKIRLYSVMASAGTGNFIDGNDYELIEVGSEVPASADFGIQISGNSMEPKYTNHQIVWVQKQDSLVDGEIGIFSYNGDAFCKKLQDNTNGLFLVSLNKDYNPIEIKDSDNLKIFGKVVG